MKGIGMAYGATTIVNAMPSGLGASLGVNLRTFAEVELNYNEEISVEINGRKDGRINLAVESFKIIMEKLGLKYGAFIRTWSEIPIAKGMKSSSAASNAIILATLDALEVELNDLEVVNLGVDASIRAKATLTGAFDDAIASYFGGIHLTDNYRRKILKSIKIMEPLSVIFLVPEGERYSGDVKLENVNSVKNVINMAFKEAIEGRIWQAMIINGLIMAHVFGYDIRPIIIAIENGAISAGLCGKGPAICAICKEDSENQIIESWKEFSTNIIKAKINHKKAQKGVNFENKN
ncbi:MAG: shikimate kinase [Candidatus Methanomethyliaceae archaeon]|nr:shikimate kinase [Candidatus Methanomethyliaceae archaeon]MDW7970565.1 shikimate kinase [Nitrososphaerota archaeon]